MSTVKLSHPNPLTVAEARRRLTGAIARYARIYGVEHSWDGDTLVLTGALLSGRAVFGERSIDVDLTLGPGTSAKDRDDVEWGVRQEFERQLR